MGMVLLMVVVVVDQGRKMTAGGRVFRDPRRRLDMPMGMPRMRAMGVPRMRIMGVPRMRTMGMPRMRTMGAPCFIAWTVCLRDSNSRLGWISLGRCDARCENAGSKAFLDPGSRRGFAVQSLDSRQDVGPDLIRAHDAPVDELGIGTTERLRVTRGFGVPERGVICMEWKKV